MTLIKEAEPATHEFITLSPFTKEFTEKMVEWFMNPEINQYVFYSNADLTPQDIRDWTERILKDPNKHFFVIESDYTPIGVISMKQMKDAPTIGEIGIAIGDKAYQEKGIGKYAVTKMLGIAKNELKMTDILAIIHPANVRSINLFTGSGFQKTDVKIEGMDTFLKTL